MDVIVSSSAPFIENFTRMLPRLLSSMVFFVVTLYASAMAARATSRALKYRKVDPELSLLLVRATKLTIVITGTIIALQQVGFDLTAFVAGLGIIGFTLGFALQDVSKNLVAGVLLLLQQPFDIGDTVEVGGYTGVVTNINLRATEVQTYDGVIVLIPNTIVYSKPVRNFNRVDRCCIEMNISVAYGSDVAATEMIVRNALVSLPGIIMHDPAPRVIFNRFGESAIELSAYYWIEVKAVGQWYNTEEAAAILSAALEQNTIEANVHVQSFNSS